MKPTESYKKNYENFLNSNMEPIKDKSNGIELKTIEGDENNDKMSSPHYSKNGKLMKKNK